MRRTLKRPFGGESTRSALEGALLTTSRVVYGPALCQSPQTCPWIGGQMGITRERVRQIEARALEKLRASRDARQLFVYNAA